MKRPSFIIITALFLFIQISGTPAYGADNPLQKVQLKIEGLHNNKSLNVLNWIKGTGSAFISLFIDVSPDDQQVFIKKLELALLSVPGVKTVEFRIKETWFFFKDYRDVHAIVEFELGTLTSETLIRAAESASDAKHIYKVKFIE